MLKFEDVTYALSMTLHVVEPLLLLYKSVVLMSCCVLAPFRLQQSPKNLILRFAHFVVHTQVVYSTYRQNREIRRFCGIRCLDCCSSPKYKQSKGYVEIYSHYKGCELQLTLLKPNHPHFMPYNRVYVWTFTVVLSMEAHCFNCVQVSCW